MDFIFRAFRQLFSFTTLLYSGYLAFGVLLSQLMHIYVYQKKGGSELATWFSHIETGKPISIVLGTQMAIVFSMLLFFSFQIAFPVIAKLSLSKVFSISILVTLAICIISTLMISSIMRMPYEALFCMIPFGALILNRLLPESDTARLIDLLKFIVPLCIGLPIVMGGSGFIASFYQQEKTTIQLQLYRHLIISAYFFIGAFGFLVFPVVRQILLIKEKTTGC